MMMNSRAVGSRASASNTAMPDRMLSKRRLQQERISASARAACFSSVDGGMDADDSVIRGQAIA